MASIILYFVTLPILFVIDIVWIGLVANRFYKEQMGDLFAPTINWPPAVLFYLIYIAAIVFFVLTPALEKQSLWYAILAGAFLGLTAYATYDLTNLAVVRNWPLLMSVVDIIWGAFLTAAVSGVAYLIATTFLGR